MISNHINSTLVAGDVWYVITGGDTYGHAADIALKTSLNCVELEILRNCSPNLGFLLHFWLPVLSKNLRFYFKNNGRKKEDW